MLPVSITRQHAPTPPQPSPLQQGLCAWEQWSSTWRHRSGLGAPNWTLTQPPGSKSGAWGKHWVQHQETQNSCLLATRTRTVPGRRSKPALTSQRKPGYRSIPIRDCQKHKQKEQSRLECPKRPRFVPSDKQQTKQTFSCSKHPQKIQLKSK